MVQPRRPSRQQPAMIAVPLTAPAAGLVSGAVMCAVSLVASARPMQMEMPKMPKIEMPKMPNFSMPKINLPGQGKTEAEARKPKVTGQVVRAPAPGTVKIRAAGSGGVAMPQGADAAPSFGDLGGKAGVKIDAARTAGPGWKRFPDKRTPGAALDGFKEMARGM
jgi:hypothetical protein